MDIISRYLIFQAVVILPFLVGYQIAKNSHYQGTYTKKILRFNVIVFEPLIILWSTWGQRLSAELIFLPLSGFFLVGLGWGIGSLLSRFLGLSGKSKATYLISSSLANHGFTMGSFVCYLVLQERGLALSAIFLVYFTFYTYLFIFTYASRVSYQAKSTWQTFLSSLFNWQSMPLGAISLSLLLHGLDIDRPTIYFPFDILLFVSIGLQYFSLGTTFKLQNVMTSLKANFFLALTKFIMVPLITGLLLSLVPLDHDLKLVILIESCMPAAVFSVVTSILFDLDSPLASGLFVVNVVLFIMTVLPMILLFSQLF